MDKKKGITVREFKAKLSYYMRLMRKGEGIKVGDHVYGVVTTDEEIPGNLGSYELTNEEKEEAGIPVMARCKNCGMEYDIKKVPCYETWSEEFGEDVIICDNCVKFKAGGNRKIYLNMLKTMKRI